MSDPKLAGAKAVRYGKQDPETLPAWIPGGKDSGNTWRTGISDTDLAQAAA